MMQKKDQTFEEALVRLEEILQALESGDCALDAMLKFYEEGVALIRTCNEQLEEAEQSVKMLSLQSGGVTLTDFDPKGEA